MTTPNQRSAQNALNLVRPIMARLDVSRHPEDLAADLIEGWNGTEIALRSLLGGSALAGQSLIRELRQREMLSLAQTHALMEFLAVRERAGRTDYRPTPADVAAARHGFQELDSALSAPPTAEVPLTAAPSAVGDNTTVVVGEPRRAAWPFAIGAIVLLLLALGGFFAWRSMERGRTDGSVTAEGAALLQQGRRGEAQRAFEDAARAHPKAAGPHIYLGRMARENGDFAAAAEHLRRAIELEPDNYLGHREMGSWFFARGQFAEASRFYQRAVERNAEDKLSMGYLGCSLARSGRPDVAVRFFDRAGQGDWSNCDPRRQVPPPVTR